MSNLNQTKEYLDAVLHWRGKHDIAIKERDALQLRLNSADQRIDDLEELLTEAQKRFFGRKFEAWLILQAANILIDRKVQRAAVVYRFNKNDMRNGRGARSHRQAHQQQIPVTPSPFKSAAIAAKDRRSLSKRKC